MDPGKKQGREPPAHTVRRAHRMERGEARDKETQSVGLCARALSREESSLAVFTNQATLSYSGRSVNSNVIAGELVEALTLTKTAVTAGYAPGSTATYVVSLVNAGETPMSGVTLTDDLGAYAVGEETVYPLSYAEGSLLYYVDGVAQSAPAVTAGPPLTVTGLEIPAGDSVMLIYQAEVTPFAPLGDGAMITNTVTTAGSCGGPITASAAITPDETPRLSIAKSLSPERISGCGEVTYTFVLQNVGGAAGAEAAVSVADTFDPVLSGLAVTLDGEVMDPAGYTYDADTGAFATVPGALTVPGAGYARRRDGQWLTTPGVTVLKITGTV